MNDVRLSPPEGLRSRLRMWGRKVMQPRSETLLTLAPDEVARRVAAAKQ